MSDHLQARYAASLPPIRAHLLSGVLAFTRAACRIPGVARIALIGSLTTNKPQPKDADMLVTIADDADLALLAAQGRKLRGHAQTRNHGGEVFLANPQGGYLGRTCPWKLCAPGVRMSCDALHCGWRPFLHDDLGAIKLRRTLIAEPPIELWPQVVARVTPPPDVEALLLAPLREQSIRSTTDPRV
jgi:hypothetical protein